MSHVSDDLNVAPSVAADALYGDFEDLETGDKFADGVNKRQSAAVATGSDEDSEKDGDDQDDAPSKSHFASRCFSL